MKHKKRTTTALVKQVNEDGSVRFRLTSKKVDRHGEVVIPNGINLDNFKNNPIVLFGHGFRNNVPVGKIDPDSIKITSTYVDGNVIFDDKGEDPFASMIGDKVRNGFLNAGSIGFRPTVIGNEPVLPKQTGATIQEWELFEFSIVPIPSNADALAKRDFENECKILAPNLDDSIFTPPIKSESIESTTDLPITIKDIENVIEKAGKVLSSKNRTLVKNVADSLRGLLTELDNLLKATEPKPTTEEEEKNLEVDEAEIKRVQDVLINQTLRSLEISRLQNTLNDLKSIVL